MLPYLGPRKSKLLRFVEISGYMAVMTSLQVGLIYFVTLLVTGGFFLSIFHVFIIGVIWGLANGLLDLYRQSRYDFDPSGFVDEEILFHEGSSRYEEIEGQEDNKRTGGRLVITKKAFVHISIDITGSFQIEWIPHDQVAGYSVDRSYFTPFKYLHVRTNNDRRYHWKIYQQKDLAIALNRL